MILDAARGLAEGCGGYEPAQWPTPPRLPLPGSGHSELEPCCDSGSQPKHLRRNRALSEEHGNDRIDFQLLDDGVDRPQQTLKHGEYGPTLW
jgi:hypothetical protein